MRTLAAFLFLCSNLLSALAGVALAGQTPPPWVARHGLSSAEYQKAFDDFGKQGFQLTSVSGYVNILQAVFCGNGPHCPWQIRPGGFQSGAT